MVRITPRASHPRTAQGFRQKSIVDAMRVFAAEKGIDPDGLKFHFSEDIAAYDGSASSYEFLKKKGFSIQAKGSDDNIAPDKLEEWLTAPLRLASAFSKENPLEGFKTFATFRTCVSAATWEDVALGMNEQFKRLGSQAHVDMSLFQSR